MMLSLFSSALFAFFAGFIVVSSHYLLALAVLSPDELYDSQQKLMQANLALNSDGVPVLLDRFIENNPAGFDLKYGTLADFRPRY